MTNDRFRDLELSVARIEALCEKVDRQLETHTTQDNDNFKDIKTNIQELNTSVTKLNVLQDADDKAEEKKADKITTVKVAMLSILATAGLEGIKQLWSKLQGS